MPFAISASTTKELTCKDVPIPICLQIVISFYLIYLFGFATKQCITSKKNMTIRKTI